MYYTYIYIQGYKFTLRNRPDWKNNSDQTIKLSERLACLGNHVCLIEDILLKPLGSSEQYGIEGLKGASVVPPLCRRMSVFRTADIS